MSVQATGTNAGDPMLPPRNAWQRPNWRFLPDGNTLVSFDGVYVRWFDLPTLSLTDEVQLNVPQSAKAYVPASVVAPDGSTLYNWDALGQTVTSVDLTKKTIGGSLTLPASAVEGITTQPGVSLSSAIISPDGTQLYVSDSGIITGLPISIIKLSDLTLVKQVLPDRATRDLWVALDGKTVFALGVRDGFLCNLQPDGSLIALVEVGNFYDFVTS